MQALQNWRDEADGQPIPHADALRRIKLIYPVYQEHHRRAVAKVIAWARDRVWEPVRSDGSPWPRELVTIGPLLRPSATVHWRFR